MLVLSRKLDQQIVIGEDIHLFVVGIRGDKVQIGIEAPKHVEIDRLEVRQNKRAGHKRNGRV